MCLPEKIAPVGKDDGCVGDLCSFLSCVFTLIVWVCSPGKTVQRSKPRPKLQGLCKVFSSVGLHIWSEDVVVMLRLRWSDPKDPTVQEGLLHKAENL